MTKTVNIRCSGDAGVFLQTMQRLAYEGQIAQDYIAPIGVELRQKEHLPLALERKQEAY